MNIRVNQERLSEELERLATFSATPAPAITRVLYTESDLWARDYLKERMWQADLTVREDALGNTFARWEGLEPSLSAVATGSHIDAIPHSGRFDGTVGVLGGLEAIRALQQAGFKPKRSIELLLFTSEEPTRFGMGCLGSRALSGSLGPDEVRLLKDEEGRTVNEVRLRSGLRESWRTLDCQTTTIMLSLSCTSNKVHCSSKRGWTSASLPPSLLRQR